MNTLSSLEWGTKHFGGLLTNRHVTRRAVMAAVKLGLAESVGFGEQCDADGFLIAGRKEREGFAITQAGRDHLAAHQTANPA